MGGLGVQSIAVAVLHHVFSRSQRAAYERVVKLLGVRRLTAGFFDVSAGIGQNTGAGQLENMRRADGSSDGPLAVGGDDGGMPQDEFLDPAKLDPIQAAMYVSQMYEKEAKALTGAAPKGEDDDSGSGSDESGEDEDDDDGGRKGKKIIEEGSHREAPPQGNAAIYPKPLYDKMKKFYEAHDPTKLNTIGVGNVQVDEQKVDAELKRRFGVGLESVS